MTQQNILLVNSSSRYEGFVDRVWSDFIVNASDKQLIPERDK